MPVSLILIQYDTIKCGAILTESRLGIRQFCAVVLEF